MSGELGGPLAEIAALVGENCAAAGGRSTSTSHEGKGRFAIAGVAEAEMAPYRGPTGEVTTLNESIFSTIPGSPAYVGKAERFRMRQPVLGLDLELRGHNAIQGRFRLRAA